MMFVHVCKGIVLEVVITERWSIVFVFTRFKARLLCFYELICLFKSVCMRINLLLYIVVVLLVIHSQGQDISMLPLTGTLTISLDSTDPTSYRIVVPADLTANEDLYIHVEPTVPDPFQVPYLTVTSDNDYLQNCYNAHEEFAGICKIDSKELIQGRQFSISVKCVTSCTLNLQTYLSQIITVPLGGQLPLKSTSEPGLAVLILVQVPISADYTTVSLLAAITNIEQNVKSSDEKLDMLINYGDQSVQAPTDVSYMIGGISLFTGGRGVHLTREQVAPGSWIKIYLKLKSGVSVIFSASAVTGQNSQIFLGVSYFDSTSQQQHKTYALNVREHAVQIENKTIELVFDIYSGNPQIVIAFDRDFTQEIPFTRKTSAISYSLSPSLRSSFKFVDTVYIKVTSSISSEYYFYTKVIRDDAAFIQPYLAYFDEVEQGQVENYIMIERFNYPLSQTNQIANYSFKVTIVSGKGSFYFKRCQSIEKGVAKDQNLDDCLVLSLEELMNSTFLQEEIQNKNIINGNMMSIEMHYDINKCNELDRKAGTIYRQCAFQIIAVGESAQPFVFSLTAEKKTYNTYLKENKIVQDYISKASYVFYSFSLPTLANVTQINIFMTTFSGSSALIVSTIEQFPTLESPAGNVVMESGQKSSIVLKKEQITQEIYISVYAYQFTEVNLGVVVHRSSDTTLQNLNEIALQLGHMLTYTLSPIQQTVSFKINSNDAESIIVSLTELVGHSSFEVVSIAHIPLTCVGKKDNPFKCEIKTSKNTFYRIVVKNKQSKLSKFTISYNDGRHCTNAALNLPTYVVLHSKQNQCYTFPINRDVVIKFDSSFTHTQILNKQIQVDLYINGNQLKSIDGSHYDITAADMSTACPFGIKNPGLVKTCEISIDFISNSDKTTFFNFVLEEEDAQIALFDGIVESISDLDVSFGGGKSFYYHIYSTTPIKLFFTTKSIELTYFLVAKLVSKDDFLKQNQQKRTDMYQEYLAQADNKKKTGNLYSVQLNSAETSIVSIDQKFIRTYCLNLEECYLLLTIAPINLAVPANPDAPNPSFPDNSNIERINYEIEVTQEETYLVLGESKMGFVEQGQVYTYLIDREDAIINIRNMNKDGQKSSQCATISAGTNDGIPSDVTQVGGNFQIAKTDSIDRIYVRGDIPQCSYQISYISITQPIKTVRLSTPYELSLSAKQTQGFLFYNLHPSSFRIMQMVSAGKADIYILPFNQGDQTLDYALSMDYKAFPLVDQIDGDYVVSSSNQFFCSNCFYYVVVTTNTKFIGEIVFLRLTDAVPLTVNHIFKERLNPTSEVVAENYVFYSLTAFSITFNILSGSIQVILIDPKGKHIIYEIISETKTFTIDAVDYQSKQKIEFFSKKALYQVKVTAVEESEFYMRLDKSRATERIFEGYPSTISFTDKSPTTVQFVNSQALDEPLMLMADVIEQKDSKAILSFSLLAKLQNGQELDDKELYISSQFSENTYMLNLKNIKGAYFISVSTDVPVNVTFILFKSTLTHITPSANHLFNNQGIFQLYSTNKNVMVEIFNCKGDLSVTASKDYQEISNPNSTKLLSLKRPNYGGHYVFGVEDVQGSYYLKVNNKDESSDLEYLISYYYYDKIDPYQSIDAFNYEVKYQYGEQGLVVKVNPPVLSASGGDYLRIKNINYWAYASSGRENLNRYSHCSIKSNAIETFGHASPDITIEKALFSQFLTDNANPKSVFVSVQASIEVQIVNHENQGQKNYPKTLTILYNIIEVPTDWTPIDKIYWFTDSLFVFICWMLLPFIIAGVVIYYVLNYCFRRWMNSQHNMIEDSDGGTVHGSRIVPSTVDLRDMKSTTFQLRDMKSTTFELVHRKTNLKDADSASAQNHVKQSEEI